MGRSSCSPLFLVLGLSSSLCSGVLVPLPRCGELFLVLRLLFLRALLFLDLDLFLEGTGVMALGLGQPVPMASPRRLDVSATADP